MAKINLRDISSRAKQWDHPVKGLHKYAEAMTQHSGDILKLSKKDRERYCISVFALALQNDSNMEWWTNIPKQDPPDGFVMTLKEIEEGSHMGYMREVEVVEHRDEPAKLFDTIQKKLTENSYESNTVLGCLVLSPAIYDLKQLASQVAEIRSSVRHVFVVFSGMSMTQEIPTPEQIRTTYTMVQLVPVFQQTAFDFRPHLNDFKKRYEKGQESRLIDGNAIYYVTANPKYQKTI